MQIQTIFSRHFLEFLCLSLHFLLFSILVFSIFMNVPIFFRCFHRIFFPKEDQVLKMTFNTCNRKKCYFVDPNHRNRLIAVRLIVVCFTISSLVLRANNSQFVSHLHQLILMLASKQNTRPETVQLSVQC